MLNPNLDQWKFGKDEQPKPGTPVFILVEPDVILAVNEDMPFVRMASRHVWGTEQNLKPSYFYWKLLDFDPETEEEILQQCFSVIAWRYVEQPNQGEPHG